MQEAENECCVESNLSKKSKNEIKNKPIIKTPTDLQRLKLEKLMKNPVCSFKYMVNFFFQNRKKILILCKHI